MKILFITSRFPYPPVRGDKIRVFNLMRELAKNHEVSLASFATAEDGGNYVKLKEYIPRIERAVFKPWRANLNCLIGLFTKTPLQVHYYRSPAMRDAVAKLVDEVKPNVIHAHLIRTAPYALAYPNIPKVLDICDSMTLNYDRMLAYRRDAMSYIHRLERPRTRSYESATPLLFDANTVVSTHDRDYIANLVPGASLEIVPGGVDVDYFRPWIGEKKPRRLAFMGTMSYFPNISAMTWFVRDVLPVIKRTVPEVELIIIGHSPSADIKHLADDPVVTVTGFVDDVRPIVGTAEVFICPIRAATGFNTKIIEAMSMGLPIVATPEACEGIDVIGGENVLLASEPMAFAEAITRLLDDTALRESLGAAGREFVTRNYTWEQAAAKLEAVYKGIVR